MNKIEGGGSFSICPDTGDVTRDPESTAHPGSVEPNSPPASVDNAGPAQPLEQPQE